MLYDVKGRGRAEREAVPVQVDAYAAGKREVPQFGSRTKVELIIPDSLTKQIVDEILKTLSTGSAADSKIFIMDISEAYDIGSKGSGEIAL
jgi:nitrogen regulatory protein P-II 1